MEVVESGPSGLNGMAESTNGIMTSDSLRTAL